MPCGSRSLPVVRGHWLRQTTTDPCLRSRSRVVRQQFFGASTFSPLASWVPALTWTPEKFVPVLWRCKIHFFLHLKRFCILFRDDNSRLTFLFPLS
jgi:hypothetical protein